MSTKSGDNKGSSQVAKEEPKGFAMTLDEFCTRLSQNDKRVELIGAFHVGERKAKRIKDTEANYRSRFDAFVKKPV